MQSSNKRPLLILYKLLLETAIERGFSNNGICALVERMSTKNIINYSERGLMLLDIENARPKEIFFNSHYFWDVGKENEHFRIDFIKQRIKVYEKRAAEKSGGFGTTFN